MGEEDRERRVDMMEMRTDIKTILTNQSAHIEWQKAHIAAHDHFETKQFEPLVIKVDKSDERINKINTKLAWYAGAIAGIATIIGLALHYAK